MNSPAINKQGNATRPLISVLDQAADSGSSCANCANCAVNVAMRAASAIAVELLLLLLFTSSAVNGEYNAVFRTLTFEEGHYHERPFASTVRQKQRLFFSGFSSMFWTEAYNLLVNNANSSELALSGECSASFGRIFEQLAEGRSDAFKCKSQFASAIAHACAYHACVYHAYVYHVCPLFPVIDSTSHSANMLDGTLTEVGDYDQCLAIGGERARGQYCMVTIFPEANDRDGRAGHADHVARLRLRNIAYKDSGLSLAACLPAECSIHELFHLMTLGTVSTCVRVHTVGDATDK